MAKDNDQNAGGTSQSPGGTPAPGKAPIVTPTPAVTTFSIVVNINDKDLEFSIGDLKKAKDDGFEFSQDTPIKLGTIRDFEKFLAEHSIDIPSASALPAPLDSIYEKATTAELSLYRLHFKQQPASVTTGNLYTIKFKLGWDTKPKPGEEAPPKLGPLTLGGFILGVRNEPEKKKDPSPAAGEGKDDKKTPGDGQPAKS